MTSRHQPLRPSWRCAGCGDEWPCLRRRDELTVESDGSRVTLSILMAGYFAEAVDDHPEVPGTVLYLRFLGWLRPSR